MASSIRSAKFLTTALFFTPVQCQILYSNEKIPENIAIIIAFIVILVSLSFCLAGLFYLFLSTIIESSSEERENERGGVEGGGGGRKDLPHIQLFLEEDPSNASRTLDTVKFPEKEDVPIFEDLSDKDLQRAIAGAVPKHGKAHLLHQALTAITRDGMENSHTTNSMLERRNGVCPLSREDKIVSQDAMEKKRKNFEEWNVTTISENNILRG